jgi:hypothetical protein
MSAYLEGYGADDARREKIRNRILLALGILLVAAAAAYFLFRDFREKKQAEHFFDLLRARNYETAYELWGCKASAPCRDYNYERFLEDWGPKVNLSKMTVVNTQHCSNGILQTIRFGSEEPIPLWVNRGDLQLSFAPWPKCDFRFQMPAQP